MEKYIKISDLSELSRLSGDTYFPIINKSTGLTEFTTYRIGINKILDQVTKFDPNKYYTKDEIKAYLDNAFSDYSSDTSTDLLDYIKNYLDNLNRDSIVDTVQSQVEDLVSDKSDEIFKVSSELEKGRNELEELLEEYRKKLNELLTSKLSIDSLNDQYFNSSYGAITLALSDLNSKVANADAVIDSLKTKGGLLNPYTISELMLLTESKSNIYIKGLVSYDGEPEIIDGYLNYFLGEGSNKIEVVKGKDKNGNNFNLPLEEDFAATVLGDYINLNGNKSIINSKIVDIDSSYSIIAGEIHALLTSLNSWGIFSGDTVIIGENRYTITNLSSLWDAIQGSITNEVSKVTIDDVSDQVDSILSNRLQKADKIIDLIESATFKTLATLEGLTTPCVYHFTENNTYYFTIVSKDKCNINLNTELGELKYIISENEELDYDSIALEDWTYLSELSFTKEISNFETQQYIHIINKSNCTITVNVRIPIVATLVSRDTLKDSIKDIIAKEESTEKDGIVKTITEHVMNSGEIKDLVSLEVKNETNWTTINLTPTAIQSAVSQINTDLGLKANSSDLKIQADGIRSEVIKASYDSIVKFDKSEGIGTDEKSYVTIEALGEEFLNPEPLTTPIYIYFENIKDTKLGVFVKEEKEDPVTGIVDLVYTQLGELIEVSSIHLIDYNKNYSYRIYFDIIDPIKTFFIDVLLLKTLSLSTKVLTAEENSSTIISEINSVGGLEQFTTTINLAKDAINLSAQQLEYILVEEFNIDKSSYILSYNGNYKIEGDYLNVTYNGTNLKANTFTGKKGDILDFIVPEGKVLKLYVKTSDKLASLELTPDLVKTEVTTLLSDERIQNAVNSITSKEIESKIEEKTRILVYSETINENAIKSFQMLKGTMYIVKYKGNLLYKTSNTEVLDPSSLLFEYAVEEQYKFEEDTYFYVKALENSTLNIYTDLITLVSNITLTANDITVELNNKITEDDLKTYLKSDEATTIIRGKNPIYIDGTKGYYEFPLSGIDYYINNTILSEVLYSSEIGGIKSDISINENQNGVAILKNCTAGYYYIIGSDIKVWYSIENINSLVLQTKDSLNTELSSITTTIDGYNESVTNLTTTVEGLQNTVSNVSYITTILNSGGEVFLIKNTDYILESDLPFSYKLDGNSSINIESLTDNKYSCSFNSSSYKKLNITGTNVTVKYLSSQAISSLMQTADNITATVKSEVSNLGLDITDTAVYLSNRTSGFAANDGKWGYSYNSENQEYLIDSNYDLTPIDIRDLIHKAGAGYVANGAISWDENGKLTIKGNYDIKGSTSEYGNSIIYKQHVLNAATSSDPLSKDTLSMPSTGLIVTMGSSNNEHSFYLLGYNDNLVYNIPLYDVTPDGIKLHTDNLFDEYGNKAQVFGNDINVIRDASSFVYNIIPKYAYIDRVLTSKMFYDYFLDNNEEEYIHGLGYVNLNKNIINNLPDSLYDKIDVLLNENTIRHNDFYTLLDHNHLNLLDVDPELSSDANDLKLKHLYESSPLFRDYNYVVVEANDNNKYLLPDPEEYIGRTFDIVIKINDNTKDLFLDLVCGRNEYIYNRYFGIFGDVDRNNITEYDFSQYHVVDDSTRYQHSFFKDPSGCLGKNLPYISVNAKKTNNCWIKFMGHHEDSICGFDVNEDSNYYFIGASAFFKGSPYVKILSGTDLPSYLEKIKKAYNIPNFIKNGGELSKRYKLDPYEYKLTPYVNDLEGISNPNNVPDNYGKCVSIFDRYLGVPKDDPQRLTVFMGYDVQIAKRLLTGSTIPFDPEKLNPNSTSNNKRDYTLSQIITGNTRYVLNAHGIDGENEIFHYDDYLEHIVYTNKNLEDDLQSTEHGGLYLCLSPIAINKIGNGRNVNLKLRATAKQFKPGVYGWVINTVDFIPSFKFFCYPLISACFKNVDYDFLKYNLPGEGENIIKDFDLLILYKEWDEKSFDEKIYNRLNNNIGVHYDDLPDESSF